MGFYCWTILRDSILIEIIDTKELKKNQQL